MSSGEKKRDVACCKGAGEGSRLGVGCGRERQEGGTVVHGLSSRGGTDGGGREELRGLVGWRRWGSPAAMDTENTQEHM